MLLYFLAFFHLSLSLSLSLSRFFVTLVSIFLIKVALELCGRQEDEEDVSWTRVQFSNMETQLGLMCSLRSRIRASRGSRKLDNKL
jgi:hypothetical protein